MFMTTGPVPGDRFLQGFSGDEEKTDDVVASLHRDLIPAIEEHERAIPGVPGRSGVGPSDRLGGDGEGSGRVTELPTPDISPSELLSVFCGISWRTLRLRVFSWLELPASSEEEAQKHWPPRRRGSIVVSGRI